ncbi:MAG: TolC family protein [Thermoanaerobaculia bacterium]
MAVPSILPAQRTGSVPPIPPVGVTLAEARVAARADSPLLAAAEADLAVARGALVVARTYPFNPEVEIEAASRSGGAGSSSDRGIGVEQEVEIAGQRGKRIAVAERTVAAAEARRDRRQAEVDASVDRTFGAAVAARELAAFAALAAELAEKLRSFEEQRLEAGAGTQVDVNFARAAAARAKSRLASARAAEAEARAELGEAIGWAQPTSPQAAGDFPPRPSSLPELPALVAAALPRRGDLQALREEVARADRTVTLERALRVPNLRVGGFSRREEGDEISGASFVVPVPLFNRNRGAVEQALAAAARARADLATAELAARREIEAAYAHYRGAADAVAALQSGAVGGLEESLDLLQQSFEAGKIGSRDVLLFRRELVEARREQIEAQAELAAAVADLELAGAGSLQSTDEETP